MIPKYLYHYTSLESVKEIISNKTIKFTSLADIELNDPLEGYFKYEDNDTIYKFLDKFVYASCWTDEEKESIPMWMLYGKGKGLRIKLKSDMFSHKHDLVELENEFLPIQKLEKEVEYGELSSKLIKINKVIGPYQIQYKESIDILHNKVDKEPIEITTENNEVPFENFAFKELGNEKLDYWGYEKEYRYKVIPFDKIVGSKDIIKKFNDKKLNIKDEVFIPLVNEIEEIIIGPNCNDLECKNYFGELRNLGYRNDIKKSNLNINFKD